MLLRASFDLIDSVHKLYYLVFLHIVHPKNPSTTFAYAAVVTTVRRRVLAISLSNVMKDRASKRLNAKSSHITQVNDIDKFLWKINKQSMCHVYSKEQ